MLMSSAGKPTVSNTITIVTKPADGMPAAPIEAAVAVTLYEIRKMNSHIEDRTHQRMPATYLMAIS